MLINPGASVGGLERRVRLGYLDAGRSALASDVGPCGTARRPDAEKERAVQAAARIQELADRVAQDVGEHSSRVREISTDLSASGRDNSVAARTTWC